MSLEMRTAVITGAGGGLGSILAHRLAALNVNLALLGRTADRLDALAAALDRPAGSVYALAVDLLNPAAAASAASQVAARFGHIDILLHLVGGWTGGRSVPRRFGNDDQSAYLDFIQPGAGFCSAPG